MDNSDNESSGEEEKKVSLKDKRAEHIKKLRAKRFGQRKEKQSSDFGTMLKDSSQNPTNTLASQKRFLNIKINTFVQSTHARTKTDQSQDLKRLVGELEIVDYLTFNELVLKAIALFNSQMQDMDLQISFNKTYKDRYAFRYAKKDGHPDMNFPKFYSQQKVSDSGVKSV